MLGIHGSHHFPKKWRCFHSVFYNYKHLSRRHLSNKHTVVWFKTCFRSSRNSSSIDPLHRSSYSNPKFFCSERIPSFVENLNDAEREELFVELQKRSNANGIGGSIHDDVVSVSKSQLKQLFLFNCVPFIGFGFLDNAIMILAGESIDLTIGVTLGISTMAAAALGNLISDIAGVGGTWVVASLCALPRIAVWLVTTIGSLLDKIPRLAGYVEVLCGKLGLPVPDLTVQQAELTSSRISSHLGKAVGITIGCIIGMFPLLFISEKIESHNENDSMTCS